MRLTKQTGYAIRILIDCAVAGDELVKIEPLALRLDITRQNAFKIVHLLSRSGFLSSVRGPTGGIRLARPADQIRISDVVTAMEETSVAIAETDDQKGGDGSSPLSTLFGDALAAFISVLEAHTIADLAATNKGPAKSALQKTAPAKKRSNIARKA
jgi:Rrf2 family nitric oxide-sensitive transcriptional repressor